MVGRVAEVSIRGKYPGCHLLCLVVCLAQATREFSGDAAGLPNAAAIVHTTAMSARSNSSTTTKARLREWFDRSGWVQGGPDPSKRAKGKDNYKRGYEVRMSAAPKELAQLQRLLKSAGIEPGAPFAKSSRLVVPIYGREQTERFLNLIGVRARSRVCARPRRRS